MVSFVCVNTFVLLAQYFGEKDTVKEAILFYLYRT